MPHLVRKLNPSLRGRRPADTPDDSIETAAYDILRLAHGPLVTAAIDLLLREQGIFAHNPTSTLMKSKRIFHMPLGPGEDRYRWFVEKPGA